jgi:serine protease Do
MNLRLVAWRRSGLVTDAPGRGGSAAIIAAAMACACGGGRGHDYFAAPDVATPAADVGPDIVSPPPVLAPGTVDSVPSFVGLVRRSSPSVVNIYTREIVDRDPATRRWPVDGADSDETSLGTGLVLDLEGRILTNAHVVENAAEIRVRMADGGELQAGLVGFDPIRDLALLQVDAAPGLVPVLRGDSDAVEVGAWVIAIGNPMGLSHTVTKGIISARGRNEILSERMGYVDLLQIDAPINRGSSGGPVFDMEGRVIGVATALAAEGTGIGFAIAWNTIEDALPRLAQGGYVSRSWLGVYLDDGDALRHRLPVDAVVADSPAARAGVRPGDIITALDGRAAGEPGEFRLRVATATAGREVRLSVLRDGVPLDVLVRPEEARDVR